MGLHRPRETCCPLVYFGNGHSDNVWQPRQGVIRVNHRMSLQFFKGLFMRSNVTISFWQPDLYISLVSLNLVVISVYIVVLTLATLTGGWLRLDLRVKKEMVSHHFFVSLSFIFKLRCKLSWPWVHLNLQNLTLSSINLYIRPSGACIELYKLSLSGWNNTIIVVKLCFYFSFHFFFFFWY